jgi:hypothetical protein
MAARAAEAECENILRICGKNFHDSLPNRVARKVFNSYVENLVEKRRQMDLSAGESGA